MALPLAAALAVFLSGATPANADPAATALQQQAVPLIAPAALKDLMASGKKFALVDVREPGEFSAGHIDGATLMPLGTLQTEYAKLPKDVTLVVYCRSGKRSAKAVQFLMAHGYGRAVSLDGGFTAWSTPAP